MIRQTSLAVGAAVTLGLLSACETLDEAPGITFAKSVEQLGISPVYPPREDLQVGDLYAIEDHTEQNRLKARDAYVDTLDVRADIQRYLKTRYQFDETNVANKAVISGSSAVLQFPQADAPQQQQVPSPSDLKALPITGFPQIEVDSGISVGVQGQPQGVAAAFGFAASKTLKMSLQFGGVTSYSIPVIVANNRLADWCGTHAYYCQSDNLAYLIDQKFQLAGKDQIPGASLILIDKVYLARQITYTFNDATLAAAAAATQGAPAAPTVTDKAVTDAIATGDSSMLSALAELQQSLNGVSAQNGASGGSISVGAIDVNKVSFNQVFERPVVVGYEAVSVQGAAGEK